MRWLQLTILTVGIGLLVAPSLPYVQYWLFQNQIETFLCDNKNRPELNCEGTCFLAKQLKAQFELQLDEVSQELPLTPPHPDEVKSGPYWFDFPLAFLCLELATGHGDGRPFLRHENRLSSPPSPPPETTA